MSKRKDRRVVAAGALIWVIWHYYFRDGPRPHARWPVPPLECHDTAVRRNVTTTCGTKNAA
jgi:hypothetical protein